MNTAAIRTEIHDMVDHLDDSFLKVVHSMLATYRQEQEDAVVGYDVEGSPFYASEAKVEYAKRVEAMKKGQSTSVEELKEAARKESPKLDVTKAATATRKNVSLEQLKKEQNYQPISYKEWRAKADEIEWEESLEELLAAIK
ncbi:MAG: hypothetical protein AAF806_07530 [Bacteroidota bacterium]